MIYNKMNKLGIDPDKYKPTTDQLEKFSYVLINPAESFQLRAGDIVYLLKPGSNNTSSVSKTNPIKPPNTVAAVDSNKNHIETRVAHGPVDDHETMSHDLFNIDAEETFSLHPSSPFNSHRLVAMHSMDEIWDGVGKSPALQHTRMADKRTSLASPYPLASRFSSFKKVFFPNVFNSPLKSFREDSPAEQERSTEAFDRSAVKNLKFGSDSGTVNETKHAKERPTQPDSQQPTQTDQQPHFSLDASNSQTVTTN
jgi:hypothetical protein